MGVLKERRPADGVPVITEEAWQEILAQSLTQVADRREQERRERAQSEKEERMRDAFD
jgi:hypothetical protein